MTLRSVIKRLPFVHPAVRTARAMIRLVPRRPRPVILMYHRVASDPFDPWGLAVEPAVFADHLRWLADARIVLPLADFATMHRNGNLPDCAVAITFDDGYACSAEVAAPLLDERRMPATVFLPAELIERGAMFWWDELEDIVLASRTDRLRVDGKSVSIGAPDDADRRWPPGAPPRTPRQSAFYALWEELRARPPQSIRQAIADLREQSGSPVGDDRKRLLSPAQVRAAGSSSVLDFGSHALTHPSLPVLPGSEKKREITGSIALCAALSGRRPLAFAYPFGDHDPESEAIVEGAGFACACTTEPRPVRRSSRLFALPRMAMGNWTSRELAGAIGA